MPKIQAFKSGKSPATDIGLKISNIELDQLVFKEAEKGEGKIYPDPKAIVENALKPDSRFKSHAGDVTLEIYYNDTVFKQNSGLTQRLASKEEINDLETAGKIDPATRAASKHRTVSLPVTADAVCDGKTLGSNEYYQYLLTVVNAPNGGNSKKGNGASSSPQDMALYFSGKSTENYKKVMKEIYKAALLAQRTSEAVVIPPIGLGVYLSSLEGRDLFYSSEFDKAEIVRHKNDFTFVESTQKLYFTNHEGQYQEIEKADFAKIKEFLIANEAGICGAVHLHMGTIKSFGADFEKFVKDLPARDDRPSVTEINKANYQALQEVLEVLDFDSSNSIKAIVLCAVRKEGEDLFQNLELKTMDVLQSKGDMLQTVQQISKQNIAVGQLCAGSDHDIGGAAGDCLAKVPAMIPGEEQVSLTSDFTKTLALALAKGNVKYIPYSMEVCQLEFSQLPRQTSNVSVTKFSMLTSEKVDVKTGKDDVPQSLVNSH